MDIQSFDLQQTTMAMILNILFFAIIYFFSTLVMKKILPTKKTHSHFPPSPMSVPIIGHLHLMKSIPHQCFHKLNAKYGPIIYLRFGSVPIVVINSADIAKEFLVSNELNFVSRPTTSVITYLSYNCSGFAFASYGTYWKFMKKICMSALLGHRPVAQSESIRREELHRFLVFLAKKSNEKEAVIMSDELMKMSNNIIARMMLSMRYSEKDDQAMEIFTLIREMSEIFMEFNISDYIGFLRNVDLQGIRKRSEKMHLRYDALLERIINNREEVRKTYKRGTDHVKDFLDILLDISEDDDEAEIRITRTNIKAFILDVLTAGTDSAVIPIEWAMAELINHPKMLETAQEEIGRVVGSKRLVEESDIPNLTYLQCIIRETLRVHPPAPMFLREASQDIKIRGYDIPAKTRLFFNIWSINRDPKNWERPLEFKPERFMPKGEKNGPPTSLVDVNGRNFRFSPFGIGRRACPGMSLALQEIPYVLAALIQCFDWKIARNEQGITPTCVDMTEKAGLTVPKDQPLRLIPVTRFDPFDTKLGM